MRKLIMAAVAAAWLVPAVSSAGTPVASAVLYEVNEALRFPKDRRRNRPRVDTPELARRVARASLLGTEVQPLQGDDHDIFHAGSFIQADATSNVSLSVGKGPIQGKLRLLTDTDPNRQSLDTLVVDTELSIRGDLDLTTALQGYAVMSGQWWVGKGKNRKEGTFQGLFLIPFPVEGDERYFYLDIAGEADACEAPEFVTVGGQVVPACPLESFQFALGHPLTKAVVTFFE